MYKNCGSFFSSSFIPFGKLYGSTFFGSQTINVRISRQESRRTSKCCGERTEYEMEKLTMKEFYFWRLNEWAWKIKITKIHPNEHYEIAPNDFSLRPLVLFVIILSMFLNGNFLFCEFTTKPKPAEFLEERTFSMESFCV